ncbi:MAG TPA: ATP-dependent helicase HrpB [Bryobacteraceae bacterium]|nr:ATP-dependent helicase HrpB [Bryobacteraceae bacterium]
MRAPLPVDTLIPDILSGLRESPSLVLEAPPGAGKTTRVPPALLGLGCGDVLVLEPRRLAARLAARRVAYESGQKVGQTVGYQVRFEEVAGPRTRLRFLTEGVLARRLLSDPELRGVDTVVLDEFHERHLDGDVALALLRRLQRGPRPDLRLVVMSATLETAPVAAFLGRCRVLRAEGRLFDLALSYTPVSAATLAEQVASALESLLREGLKGDVLVFLPGAAEIRQAARTCGPIAERAGLLLLPLHGDLSPEEQDRAIAPADRRKVILSTNVAESSVTIEGVRAVIDSGLARVASDSPWSGLPTLRVARVSKASATQRAGRAGRTGPGRVIRLYPAEDFHRRPEYDAPEIRRRELSQTALEVRAMGAGSLADVEWLDAPPAAAVEAAEQLLRRLGAVDAGRRLTEAGRVMSRLPLHPRLARLVAEADRRGSGDDGCVLAALLSAGERLPLETHHSGPSDLLLLLDSEWGPYTRRVYQQIRRSARPERQKKHDETALLASVLAAFPDRVARRRQGDELLLAAGGSAVLSPLSVVRARDWMVAVDIEERRERGLPLVRLASAIEPEWLLDLFPDEVSERNAVEWNRNAERVDAVSALVFCSLVIEESRNAQPEPATAAELLARKALEAGVGRFADAQEVEGFLARVAFASEHTGIPSLGDEDVKAAFESLCDGLRSFTELEQVARGGLLRALERRLPPDARRLLREAAPERIRLPGGRQVPVRYARGQPPWIASRLQDFFGLRETPRVAGGKVPLVVHLLAPNHRPVQMTADLAGFWDRLYPQVRRELSRKYPRHSWPEKPP